MTEEGPARRGVSLVRTMLGRLRVQPSSTHPDQRSKHTDQNNHQLLLDLNKRRSGLLSTDTRNSDVDSGYVESRPSSLIFPEWERRHLPSERLPELPERKQEVEPEVGQKYFSSPTHGPITFGSNGSSVSVPDPNTTPYRKNGPVMEPCRSQVTFMDQEEPQKPSLPPKQRKRNSMTLHRNFTFRDFKLNIGPIDLVEELLSGEEWAPYLLPKDLSPKTETRDQSQTQNDKNTSRHAEIKPELSDEEEMSDVRLDQTSIAVPTEQNQINQMSQSQIFAIHKSKYKYGTVSSQFQVSDGADLGPEEFPNKDLVYNSSLDHLFGFKPGDLLDNSAQKSRIKLSKKRKHRPPNKKRKEKTEATPKIPKTDHDRNRSESAPSNSQVVGNSKFYVLPRSLSCEDPQVLGRDDVNQHIKEFPKKIKLWRPRN